jgi:hypothetical protein
MRAVQPRAVQPVQLGVQLATLAAVLPAVYLQVVPVRGASLQQGVGAVAQQARVPALARAALRLVRAAVEQAAALGRGHSIVPGLTPPWLLPP